jgi:hypothetical protein
MTPDQLDRILGTLNHLNRRLDRYESQTRADDAAVLEEKKAQLATLEREELAKTTEAVVDFRVRADDAMRPYGGYATEAPKLGESPHDYRRRVLSRIQGYLPPTHALARVVIDNVKGGALSVFEDQILDAAKACAFDDSIAPPGQTVERDMSSPGGPKITGFVGESYIRAMSPPTRKVLRLIDPTTGMVLMGTRREML